MARGSLDGPHSRLDGSQVTLSSPPLYYKPVPEALSKRRLDDMRSYESGKPARHINADDIYRYSFEDDFKFVDRGREHFAGIRPPHRERERQAALRQGGAGGGGGYGGRSGFGGGNRQGQRGGDRYGGDGPRRDGFRGARTGRDDDHSYRPTADRRPQGRGDEGRLGYDDPPPRRDRGWDDSREYRDSRH